MLGSLVCLQLVTTVPASMLEGPCSLSCTEAMLLLPVVFQLVQSKRVCFLV